MKFDTLFSDPRHYRGDCRLMRTAIRRGWLDDAPQADQDALVARFQQASAERRAADPESRNLRALLAECYAMLEMEADDLRERGRALRAAWPGANVRGVGRPRERWHVGDYGERIDARALQRDAAKGGHAPGVEAVNVTLTRRDTGATRTVRLALAWTPGGVGGPRAWLVCPACGRRRAHLYAVRGGPLCRCCAGICYPRGGLQRLR